MNQRRKSVSALTSDNDSFLASLALTEMNSNASPFYPPRAHWYSSWWRLWYPLKRRLYLSQIRRIGEGEIGRFLLGLVLPGWALIWSRRPILGWILGTAYCAAIPVFVLWRGTGVSNLALTLMISIHAGSVLRLERSTTFGRRCLWSMFLFLALGALVYTPLIHQMERRWFVALRVGDHVIKVRTGETRIQVQRGDWIAYRLAGTYGHNYGGGVWVHGGCTMGRVLAVAGDDVVFGPDSVQVGSESFPRRPYMPTKGTIHVEKGYWFLWPEMAIRGHGNVGQDVVEQAMIQLANVREADYVGKAYKRWLGRPQTVP